MVVIFSSDGDHTTDVVIDWLVKLKVLFKRINLTDLIEEKKEIFISPLENQFSVNGESLPMKTIWTRKVGFFEQLSIFSESLKNEKLDLTRYIIAEITRYRESFFAINGEWLCNPNTIGSSKLKILQEAKNIGLEVPRSYIVNSKKGLIYLFNLFEGNIIVKSLSDTKMIKKGDYAYLPLTKKPGIDEINELPDFFIPSLIQQEIEKEFEIRAFYIGNDFFSAAIFSQADSQTKLDFRNYNWTKPNRIIPFLLPTTIKRKLIELCSKVQINTGSVDIIKSKKGIYYFLEINAGGQFGNISHICNYNLEMKVAEFLINTESNAI